VARVRVFSQGEKIERTEEREMYFEDVYKNVSPSVDMATFYGFLLVETFPPPLEENNTLPN
jgi:hypothetical protein